MWPEYESELENQLFDGKISRRDFICRAYSLGAPMIVIGAALAALDTRAAQASRMAEGVETNAQQMSNLQPSLSSQCQVGNST